MLAPARDDGVLPPMLDERGSIPVVAPADVGVAVADLLTRREPATGLHFVEGPERYSPTRGSTTLQDYVEGLVRNA